MSDSCHRGLSWLLHLKPCIPSSDPHHHFTTPIPILTPTPTLTTIASLPDDLLLDCLARLPTSSLPSLPLVSRRFLRLVTSPSFASLRRRLNLLTPSLIAVSVPSSSPDLNFLSVSTLRFEDSGMPEEFETSTFKFPLSVAVESFSNARAVAIGRSVYLIWQGFMVRFDVWTGSVRVCAEPLFPRKKFAAVAVDGRILIAGGSSRTSAVEEYDPGSDSWRVVAEAPCRRYSCVGAATAGGIFYIAGGLKINRNQNTVDARTCAGSFDAYHIASGTWLRTHSSTATTVPAGGCILAGCGIGDMLYIIASHALEVSFWRYNGEASSSTLSNRGGGKSGRWDRLKPPPVPGQVGTGLRFSCTAIGASKVAVMVHVLTDVRWRMSTAHRVAAAAGVVDGAILIYDVLSGEWTRGPVVPSGSRRTSCIAVEC